MDNTATAAGRTVTSQKLADNLKNLSQKTVQVTMPHQDELKKAAKHIEWLELILTGISYADRRTIAKLTRKVRDQKRMLGNRDDRLNRHKLAIKALKQEHAKSTKKALKFAQHEIKRAGRITHKEEIDRVEKQFIKDLQTGFQKGNALSQARWEEYVRKESASSTCTTGADSGGWKQYIEGPGSY